MSDNSNNSSPNVLLADKAILIATQEELEEKSPYYTDGTYTYRFVRVPQFLFNMAAAHLRSQMRKLKPQPPVIRKSGREMVNKADPIYLEKVSRWNQEWQDLTTEANLSTSMFSGVEVEGGTPPDEEWLPNVIAHFVSVGITQEQAHATFYHEPSRLRDLWFKKFVILKSKAAMELFAEFQGGKDNEDGEEDIDIYEDGEFAVELFQSEESG